MTDPIEPTAANQPVTEPTAAQPKEPEKLFKTFASKKEHDDYINEITKERLDRERKKFADYDDLKAKAEKLKQFEEKDLTDVEKLKREHETATGKLSELTNELTGVKQENAKLKALIKAGVSPDQLDGLLKRVSGSTEEEILADVEELKSLGWIGKPQTPEPKGLGTQTKSGEPIKKVSLKDQLAEISAKLKDKSISAAEKQELARQSISINNRLIRGET